MRYKTLGSHRPYNERQRSFLRSREVFERERDTWLADECPAYVTLRHGEVLGFAGGPHLGQDDCTFSMRIISREEEEANWRKNTFPSISWLAEPFLDTDMPDCEFMADRILELRGYSPWKQYWLRSVLATGWFWNAVLWWDWVDLDLRDFFLGWALNFALLSLPICALLAAYVNTPTGLLTGIACWLPMLAFQIWRPHRPKKDDDKNDE